MLAHFAIVSSANKAIIIGRQYQVDDLGLGDTRYHSSVFLVPRIQIRRVSLKITVRSAHLASITLFALDVVVQAPNTGQSFIASCVAARWECSV